MSHYDVIKVRPSVHCLRQKPAKAHDTRTKIFLARVSPNTLSATNKVFGFSHETERVPVRANLSCEFLVRISLKSFSYEFLVRLSWA